MKNDNLSWTTTHHHATGDFVCDFGNGLTISVNAELKTAYKQKDGNVIEKFSIDGMHVDVFHQILVGVAKSINQ